jgi:Raf kinase inhibitor-like YbhB/YbcL family protein
MRCHANPAVCHREAGVLPGRPGGRLAAVSLAALLALVPGCGSRHPPGEEAGREAPSTARPGAAGAPRTSKASEAFVLTSSAFTHGSPIPIQFTCDGGDQPPPLQWTGAPPGTRSFALIVHDPDAPGGDFAHLVTFNLPPAARAYPPDGAAAGVPGTNDFGKSGYNGPCPPRGHGRHRYYFTLSALDRDRLDLPQGARRAEVESARRGHMLAQAELMGTYERR